MSYRKNANYTPKTVYKKQQLAQMNRAVQQLSGKGKTVRVLGNNAMVMNVPNYQPALKRATPQEVNYVDLGQANYGFNSTGTITLLATIAQGASVNQRIGKRAYYKSLLIRGWIQNLSTAVYNDVTILIIYDKRPTGALPLITDILTAATPTAFMNDNNTGRFEVIRRIDCMLIGNTASPSTGEEVKSIDEYIRLKKRPITFESAGTGAIGDIDSGALYMITLGMTAAGTAAATSTLNCRVRFTEQ